MAELGIQWLIYNLKTMRWILIMLLPFFFANCNQAQTSAKSKQVKPITSPKSILIDVRKVGEYQQGSAGDAINIPVNDLENRLDELPKDKSVEITVFCLSGGRSAHAKVILEDYGYTNVQNGGTVNQMRAKLKKTDSEKAKSKT